MPSSPPIAHVLGTLVSGQRRFIAKDTPIKGYGETSPVANNTKPDGSDNPKGQALNRRVEIVISNG